MEHIFRVPGPGPPRPESSLVFCPTRQKNAFTKKCGIPGEIVPLVGQKFRLDYDLRGRGLDTPEHFMDYTGSQSHLSIKAGVAAS